MDVRSAAVLARSVVAGSHDARLLVPGASAVPVGYVEDDGQPVLVVGARGGPFTSSPGLTVVAGGVEVHLGGRLRRLCHADQSLADQLNAHSRCLLGPNLRPGRVDLIRLEIERVCVRPAGGADPIAVPVADYALAEPEPFATYQHRAIAHVEDRHADGLARLAADRLGLDRSDVIALRISGIRADEVTLSVVTATGGWNVPVPIAPPLADPRDLCRRLAAGYVPPPPRRP